MLFGNMQEKAMQKIIAALAGGRSARAS